MQEFETPNLHSNMRPKLTGRNKVQYGFSVFFLIQFSQETTSEEEKNYLSGGAGRDEMGNVFQTKSRRQRKGSKGSK